MDFRCIVVIFYISAGLGIPSSSGKLRVRRGFGGGGHAGLSNLGGYAPGYGSGPAGQAAGYAALQEIRNNQNIAFWAANAAVASAVANDYRNQQSTTSQFAHQFIVPVTKSQNYGKGTGGHNRGEPSLGHGGGMKQKGHGGTGGRGHWKPVHRNTQNRQHDSGGQGRRGNEIHERERSKNGYHRQEYPHREIQHDPEHGHGHRDQRYGNREYPHEHPEHRHEHPEHRHEHPEHRHEHPEHRREHPEHRHEHPEHRHEHPEHHHEHPERHRRNEVCRGKK